MRKKTKWLAAVLCLSIFALMALGSGSSDSNDKKDVVTTDDDKEKTDSNNNDNSSSNVIIEEQTLVNQNDIVITAKEYVSDSIWGDGIKVMIENNSAEDVTIGCSSLIVNDYMIADLFSAQVAAGKKSNETIYLSSSELEASGIDTVGKIEIYFQVNNSASYNKIFDTDCVTIQTSEFDKMDTAPNDAGTELYNEGGVRIVGKTVDEDSFWGAAILLYCENTSGKKIGISVDDMSINGFMMNPLFSTTIYDGKKSIDDVTIFSNQLEENGINSIDTVELKFHIYDADTFQTITDSEPITFSAK